MINTPSTKIIVFLGLFLLSFLPFGQWLGTHFGSDFMIARMIMWLAGASVQLLFIFILLGYSSWFRRAADKIAVRVGGLSPNVYQLFCVILFLLCAGFLKVFVELNQAYIEDEAAQLIHAHAIAKGQLTLTPPLNVEFFHLPLTFVHEGRWLSQYPVGNIAVIALGLLLGSPHLLFVALGAVSVCMVYQVARLITRELYARLACLLMACSPFVALMSLSLMSHVPGLLCALFVLFLYIRLHQAHQWQAALGLGLAAGILFLIRPYTAMAILSPIALHALWFINRRRVVLYALALVSMICGMLPQFWFNAQLFGDPWLFAYEVLHGPETRPGGFHPIPETFNSIFGPLGITHHTPALGLGHASNLLLGVNLFLLGWVFPALLIVFYGLVYRRTHHWHYLLFAIMLSPAIFYIFYFYQDWFLGPRFMYEISGAAIILTALFLPAFFVRTRQLIPENYRRYWRLRYFLPAQILGVFLISSFFFISKFSHGRNSGVWYIQAHVETPAMIFVHESLTLRYLEKIALMHLDSEQDIVWANDKGDKNQELLEQYPNYNAYYVVELNKKPYLLQLSPDL